MSDRPSATVSVVIPNYNYAKTLGACLQAVVDQSHRPAEIVVVDDGSSDTSVNIARSFPCTVVRTANRGVSAARNLGVEKTTGDVIFFLDSDIALRPDAIECAVRLLEADPGLGFVCGVYDSEPLFDDGVIERYKVLHGHFWRVRGAGPVHAAFFSLGALRRTVFEMVGPLDETLRATEDVEYGARMAPVSRLELSPAIVGRHDDDDRLSVLLRKQFHRSVPLVSLFAERGRGKPKLAETAYRPVAAAGISLAVVCLPLAWWSIALGVVGAAGLGLFTVVERRLFGFARRRAGAGFVPVFYGLHALMTLTTAAAAGIGVCRWLVSREFRRLYAGASRRYAA
jgi:hypothetical protein